MSLKPKKRLQKNTRDTKQPFYTTQKEDFKNKLRRIRHSYNSFKEAVTAAWNSMGTLSG